MSIITYQTRQLSFEDIKDKKKKRYEQILDRLMTGIKTAKEIAVEMFELEQYQAQREIIQHQD